MFARKAITDSMYHFTKRKKFSRQSPKDVCDLMDHIHHLELDEKYFSFSKMVHAMWLYVQHLKLIYIGEDKSNRDKDLPLG
jgi:hypothetical protein